MSLRTQLTLLYALPFLASGLILVSIPIFSIRESSPAGTGTPPHEVDSGGAGAALRHLLGVSAVAFVLLVFVSFLLGWWISGRFLRPLRTITATAREISATNLHRRLGLSGRGDEFGDLADTLDDLFSRLENSFAAQRNFVANASHELRTPLTAERTLLQVTLADPDATADSLRSACREVLALGEHQERLIDSLLTLASSERGIEQRLPVDLAAVTSRVLSSRPPDGVTVSLAPAPIVGEPELIASMVANLVDNALRHNVSGGQVWVTVSPSRLTVSNTGPVVPADEVDRLFQPFQQLGRQRTQRSGGHGLGLAIVRAIASAHGADLTATPRDGGGLTVTVRFP